ncbi:MAG: NifB/NifX family molybdenum-iron cluster-binding protein [Campylobacterota bacterium]|nr:NifB/NifX family molybdenum-iron cluster-binding protein [Campylobacterota bacterium]
MRIVFPTNENIGYLSKRGAHFGKANFYTIITLDNGQISDVDVIENPGHSTGGCGDAITNIMNLKPDALVVSGIGGSPAKGFAQVGLDVYFDKESLTVNDSIDQFLLGKLDVIGSNGTCSTH